MLNMAEYGSQKVKCPFYLEKQNDQYRIKCEGIIKGTTIQLTFKGNKRWYVRDFCCSCYQECSLYKLLDKKYS